MDRWIDLEDAGDLLLLTTVLPDWYLAEIGRVVANFAILENELSSLIHGLLGTKEEITRIVTSELSFRNLVDMSASLMMKLHESKDVERYKVILKMIGEAEQNRNNIVHSLWRAGLSIGVTRTKHTAKRSKGLQLQSKKYQLEDLQDVAIQIVRTIRELKQFRESLGYMERLS